jgi:hypothetical protein
MEIGTQTRPTYVRRLRNEHIAICHIVQHRPFLRRLIIWGCIMHTGPASLAIINGTMTSAKYIATLQDNIEPFKEKIGWFQQGNAPSHKSEATLRFLDDNAIRVLDWPPYSPDLNCIDNIWAVLKM